MKYFPKYGLTQEQLDEIARAAALHDIGKIGIPDAILLKPGRLTAEEFETMKTHTTMSVICFYDRKSYCLITSTMLKKSSLASAKHSSTSGENCPHSPFIIIS